MSDARWRDVVDLPDELDDETAERLHDRGDEVQGMTGEVCPFPEVKDLAETNVWKSGDGRYRILLRKR